MSNDTLTAWLLRCPECGERVAIELADDLEGGGTGIELCGRGHQLVFHYDGATVEMLGVVTG
jgi:hypothetical protein